MSMGLQRSFSSCPSPSPPLWGDTVLSQGGEAPQDLSLMPVLRFKGPNMTRSFFFFFSEGAQQEDQELKPHCILTAKILKSMSHL